MMNIDKKENYLLIKSEKADLTMFTSELTKHHERLKNDNVVIDLSGYKDIKTENLLGFLEFSEIHRNANKSFILINDAVGIDELPEELVVVPTLKEAEDMIQMDEIQRDLGF